MIETSLVYIHSAPEPSGFEGCGVIIEGPFIVTCRHVWDEALAASKGGGVYIHFPPLRGQGGSIYQPAALIDACRSSAPEPDLVILAAEVPAANSPLPLARNSSTECGPGFAWVGLPKNGAVRQVKIPGDIAEQIADTGLRQFTGQVAHGYWTDHGASGSPLMLQNGNELAGMLTLSETGERSGEAKIHEAFALPASIIHLHLRHHIGREAARAHGIDAARVPQILTNLGAADISIAELRLRLEGYIADIKSFIAETKPVSAEVPPPSNRGGDTDAAIAKSQKLAAEFRPGEAMDVLDRQIADEKADRRQRLVPLLAEKARQQRLVFNHEAAKATLTELLALDPEQIWHWIDLGDLHQTTGSLTDAARTFKAGLEAARTVAGHDPHNTTNQRDISVLLNRLGDIQQAQGDLQAALASFQAAMQIAENLAKTDPRDTLWQRDLFVSHNRIGDIQKAQGDLQAALASFQAAMQIAENLAKTNPRNTEWQRDLSVSHEKLVGIQQAQGDLQAALASFQAAMQIRESLAKTDPHNTQWQRDLSIPHDGVGDIQQAQGDKQAALASFRAAMQIRENLAKTDPRNTEWQRDLFVSHTKIGGIQQAQGDLRAALASFQAAMQIAENLVKTDPRNTQWQRDLALSLGYLARAEIALHQPEPARSRLRRAEDILQRLIEISPDDATLPNDLAWIRTLLKTAPP